jgi:hypothetical protein
LACIEIMVQRDWAGGGPSRGLGQAPLILAARRALLSPAACWGSVVYSFHFSLAAKCLSGSMAALAR